MLPKPSIFKVPRATSAINFGTNGCNSGYKSECNSGYSCDCVDKNTCDWGLAIGIGGAVLTIGIGAIALT